MSYILDALQRHEAQQNPEAAAALVIKQHKDQRIKLVGALVAVALMVNAAILLWLLWPARAPEIDQTPPPALVVNSAESPLPTGTILQTPEPADPAAGEPELPPPAAVTAKPRRVRTRLQALPDDAKSRFPGLVFSTHIYAEDAELRAVVANGRRLTQGDSIAGVRVQQITQSGVLVAFETYLVEIPVIADWQ